MMYELLAPKKERSCIKKCSCVKVCFLDMGWFFVLRIGVSDLHHSCGEIGQYLGIAVAGADPGVTAEDMGAAVLTAENGPFGEDSQTTDGGTAAVPGCGICQNPVIKGDVDAVMMAIEGHRLYFNGGIEQFRAADLGAAGAVQNCL